MCGLRNTPINKTRAKLGKDDHPIHLVDANPANCKDGYQRWNKPETNTDSSYVGKFIQFFEFGNCKSWFACGSDPLNNSGVHTQPVHVSSCWSLSIIQLTRLPQHFPATLATPQPPAGRALHRGDVAICHLRRRIPRVLEALADAELTGMSHSGVLPGKDGRESGVREKLRGAQWRTSRSDLRPLGRSLLKP